MHFAKSFAIREKTNVIRCAVTDFNSILAETTAYSIIIEFAIREASIEKAMKVLKESFPGYERRIQGQLFQYSAAQIFRAWKQCLMLQFNQ